MKLLITGANGQVGSELIEAAALRAHTAHGYSSRALDITDKDRIATTVAEIRPDVIINAAAYTAVDRAEEDQELAYAVNATGVENLARICKQQNIPLLHISTDYVFDGEKNTAYTETDPTRPCGVYGASKLQGDRLLQSLWDRHIILRVSWVFGTQGNNFVKTMLRLGRDRDQLSVVNDQRGAPTSARSIALSLLDILAEPGFGEDDFPWGLYHLQSDPGVTWYEFACEIFHQAYTLKLLDKQVRLKPITSSEFPTPVKRPKNSKLDGSLLQKTFAIRPADWKNDLLEMLKSLQVG